jgi:hypothetical protein
LEENQPDVALADGFLDEFESGSRVDSRGGEVRQRAAWIARAVVAHVDTVTFSVGDELEVQRWEKVPRVHQ